MYLKCPECKTRYEISAARIPDTGARVRCPRCRTVFQVTRPANGNGATAPPAAHSVVPGAPVDPDVARRIARSLVSELLLARREERDEALRSGKLLSRLGSEIVSTWDSYRQRVGMEIAGETRFFQDAVNDILADGETIL
jgi:predicted Zn finger-like uncharacterized protein